MQGRRDHLKDARDGLINHPSMTASQGERSILRSADAEDTECGITRIRATTGDIERDSREIERHLERRSDKQ